MIGANKCIHPDRFHALVKKNYHWLTLIGLITAGAVFILANVAALILNSTHFRDTIQSAINAQISGTLSWERHSISPLTARVQLWGARVSGQDGERIISCAHILVDLSLLGLLRHEIVMTKVRLWNPIVSIGFDDAGKVTIAQAFIPAHSRNPGSTSKPWRIMLRGIDLRNGLVDITTPNHEVGIKSYGVAIKGAFDISTLRAWGVVSVGQAIIRTPQVTYSINSLSAGGVYRDLRVDSAFVSCHAGGMGIYVEGGIADLGHALMIDAKASLSGCPDTLLSWFGIEHQRTGAIAAELVVDGPLGDPMATATIRCSPGAIAAIPVDSIGLWVKLRERILMLDSMDVRTGEGRFFCSGMIDGRAAFPRGLLAGPPCLDSLRYSINAECLNIDPQLLIKSKDSHYGLVSARIDLRGRGSSLPTIEAALDGRLQVKGIIPDPGETAIDGVSTFSMRVRDGIAALDTFEVEADGLNFTGQGSMRVSDHMVKARMSVYVPDVKQFLPVFGLNNCAGAVNATVAVNGLLPRPDVSGSIDVTGARFKQYLIGNAAVAVNLSQTGALSASRMSIVNGESRLVVSGSVDLFKPGGYRLVEKPLFSCAIDSGAVDLTMLSDSLSGTVQLRGQVQGTGTRGYGWIRAGGERLQVYGQSAERMDLYARLDSTRVLLDSCLLTVAPGQSVRADGWISLAREFGFNVTSTGILFDNIGYVRKVAATLKGRVRVSASGTGTIDNPQITVESGIDNLALNGAPLDSVRVRCSLRDSVVDLTGRSTFDFNGRYFLADRKFDGTCSLRATELGLFFDLAGMPRLHGTADGLVTLSGRIDAPDKIDARLQCNGLSLYYDSLACLKSPGFAASFSQGRLKLPNLTGTLLDSGSIAAHGEGALYGPYDFSGDASLPARLLELWAPEITDGVGMMSVHVDIGGTQRVPRISATLSTRDFGCTVPQINQRLHACSVVASFSDNVLILTDAHGALDDGTFSANGRIDFLKLRPGRLDLNLKARSLPLRWPGVLDSRVNADVQLSGMADSTRLDGAIDIVDAVYTQNWATPLDEVGVSRRRAEPWKGVELPYLRRMTLDIDIKPQGEVHIDNNFADMKLQPDVSLLGNLAAPVVVGKATVLEGELHYLRRSFSIYKGVIDFADPYATAPVLDIAASSIVGQWTIGIEAKGPPDNIEFSRTSQPYLQDADILSLLLVGKTTDALQGSALDSTFRPGSQVQEIVTDLVGTFLNDQIRSVTGLDVLKVDGLNSLSTAAKQDLLVTVGKNLTRRLATQISVGTENGALVQQAVIEYKLLENLLLRSVNSSQGSFGGEVRALFEFR
jgi:translocation and assembly module TamB